jgi:hypothetical protein
MIEVFDFAQGSPEWFAVRLGIPTASEFGAVKAKGEGKTRRTYMMKLIGELMTGEPSESFSNAHMERGKEMEPDARNLYAFHLDLEPVQVGFIRNGRKGCSPDSLVGTNGMSEIKTKLPHLQAEVLLADRLPPEHEPQCQGNLWVAEREWIDFVSYWPKMPLFVKRVYRDEIYIKNLAAEVDLFNAELDTYLATLRQEPLRVTA